MHHPVLLKEAVEGLNVRKGGLYIDATFGEGGHTLAILEKGGLVLGIDYDREQYQKSKIKNLKLVNDNFKNIEKIAKENNFYPVDGILFDLGLSMEQIDNSGKGFSFKKKEEPLDMRINNDLEQTAADLINHLSEDELYEIFAKYSEELNSRAIVQNIIFTRRLKKIETVGDLVSVIDRTLKTKDERVYRRIFQALRIAVNNELDNLRKGLTGAIKLLKKNGRVAVISFHSIEDRIIKNFIKENKLEQINKKIIFGDPKLSFERSAKMRIFAF